MRSSKTAYAELIERLKGERHTWLITGVAGFIGSNLLETLLRLNQKVIGLDNFSTGYQGNLVEVSSLVTERQWQNFSLIKGDIRNVKDCIAACKDVEYVLHQAALGSVPRSILDPITTNDVNISGHLNMMVAARDSKVKRFVYASSSSVYGDYVDLPKIESKIGKPLSPYSATKYVNELYADIFSKVYGVEVIGLRYFNVFGRRQSSNGAYAAVVPRWVAAICAEEAVEIYGDGDTSRDFCYVENAVQANLLSAMTNNTLAINQIYNIAVGESTSLNKAYEMISNRLKNLYPNLSIKEPIYGEFRKSDVRHSLADISKASSLLGYQPMYSFSDGLNLLISLND